MNSIQQEVLTIENFCDNVEQIITKSIYSNQKKMINEVKNRLQYRNFTEDYFSEFKNFINYDLKIIEHINYEDYNVMKENIINIFTDKLFKLSFINKTDINNSYETVEKIIPKIFKIIQENLIINLNTTIKTELLKKLKKKNN